MKIINLFGFDIKKQPIYDFHSIVILTFSLIKRFNLIKLFTDDTDIILTFLFPLNPLTQIMYFFFPFIIKFAGIFIVQLSQRN